MANQKAKKAKTNGLQETGSGEPATGEITSNLELKTFLQSLLDRMGDGQVATVFALSAINHLLSKQEVSTLFCPETKELARDIWLRIKLSGVQVRNPVFLFASEAQAAE